jgi:hypothetical protein
MDRKFCLQVIFIPERRRRAFCLGAARRQKKTPTLRR